MGEHRAPESGEMQAPGPVCPPLPSNALIKRAGQIPVDTDPPNKMSTPTFAAGTPLPPELTWVDPRIMDDETKRPEPVLDAARVAGAISAVILAIGGLLKLVGIAVPDDYDLQPLADQAADAVLSVGGAWTVFGPWITARIGARDKVTPLADPRDAHGRPLTPEDP
jgi:hypothetical protein